MKEADSEKLAKDHLENQDYRILKFEPVPFADQEVPFKARLKLKGKKNVIFVREICNSAVFDICHDTHFGRSFDRKGNINYFTSIYLPKSYNKEWDKKNVQKFRQRSEIIPLMNPLNLVPKWMRLPISSVI
jgi:hypothetical protein